MFTVTAAALNRLSRKLTGKKANDDEALRFTHRTGGWSLGLDCARHADTRFMRDGRSVLLLDTAVSQAMANMTLDIRSTSSGPRLKLRRVTSSKD
ncbi:MAG: hypothetical protein ACYTFA_19110 [Planctomycetota bacterium]|jgi:hypothetical protein